MDIVINTNTVLEEIRQKSHLNTRSIQDPDVKVNARVGEREKDEVARCVLQANGKLAALCRKWLSYSYEPSTYDDLSLPEVFVFSLVGSPRRFSNKSEALAQDMHSYIINAALARYYSTVANGDLMNLYENKALADAQALTLLLNSKLPPVV